jgi:ABC-2 type transport system permease protein
MSQQPYSQARALWAITRASFKAIFNQPTAVVFSLLFPIIFILIFGAFGSGGGASYRITMAPDADTTGPFFEAIKNHPQLRIVRYADTVARNKDLVKGRLSAVIGIEKLDDSVKAGSYSVKASSTSASNNTIGAVMEILYNIKIKNEYQELLARNPSYLAETYKIEQPTISQVRKFRQIDFILPGQLGFSILFSTLFGIAFTFYSLREQLVLKRFYASPVHKIHILLGIGMSRLFFQLMNVLVLILFGHFFLNFTLYHGALTIVEMVLMTIIMLFLLMGVGLIFSSIVKSDASIPLLINLFGFPQMLLSGTFFPIEVFPKWLQQICQFLPLTQFNNAIRKISFEGLSILDCWKEIGILGLWMVVIYAILIRVIRWE